MKITKYQVYQIIVFVAYLALIIFYTVLSLQTGQESTTTSNGVTEVVAGVQEAVTGKPVEITNDYRAVVRKLFGHYGIFVGIGLFSSLFYMSLYKLKKWIRITLHIGVGLIYAIITEFVFQALAESRGPSFLDVSIDMLGFITLSIIVVIVYIVLENKKIIKYLGEN